MVQAVEVDQLYIVTLGCDGREAGRAMSEVATSDRKAAAAEVRAHAADVRRLARTHGLTNPRLREDGTVVVHSDEPGYRAVVTLAADLSEVVGTYVHVITDDVPAAVDAQPV